MPLLSTHPFQLTPRMLGISFTWAGSPVEQQVIVTFLDLNLEGLQVGQKERGLSTPQGFFVFVK